MLKEAMIQSHLDRMRFPTVNPLDPHHSNVQNLTHTPSIHAYDHIHKLCWEYKLAQPTCNQHRCGYNYIQDYPCIHSGIRRLRRCPDIPYVSDQYDDGAMLRLFQQMAMQFAIWLERCLACYWLEEDWAYHWERDSVNC